MTKRSRHERGQRASETERLRQIEASWTAGTPIEVTRAFEAAVHAARERGPLRPPPDMAPGTPPNPPRPGHEPRPPKVAARGRRPR